MHDAKYHGRDFPLEFLIYILSILQPWKLESRRYSANGPGMELKAIIIIICCFYLLLMSSTLGRNWGERGQEGEARRVAPPPTGIAGGLMWGGCAASCCSPLPLQTHHDARDILEKWDMHHAVGAAICTPPPSLHSEKTLLPSALFNSLQAVSS